MLERRINFSEYLFLVAIRYLYLYLTVVMLDGLWYQGYGSYGIDFSFEKEILASAIFLIFTLFYTLRMQEGSFSSILAHVLYCIYYIPLNCSFSINNLSLGYFVASTIYSCLLFWFLSGLTKTKIQNVETTQRTKNLDSIINNKLVWLALFVICGLYIAYKLNYNGLEFSLSLSQDDVYSNRADYVDYRSSSSGTLGAYITATLIGIIDFASPVFLYFSLRRRDGFGIAVSIFTLLCQFSVSSSKSNIFFIGILIFIFICERLNLLDRFNALFTRAIFLLMIVTLFEYIVTGNSIIYWYLLRRELYMPSWIGSMYFDFFTNNPALFFSDSTFALQSFIPDRYSLSSVELISESYFEGAMPSPNAGLFAEAMMQCGFFGILLFPLITSVLVRFAGNIFDRFGLGLACLVAVRASISLTNIPILRTDSILSLFAFAMLLAAALFFSKKRYSSRRMVDAAEHNLSAERGS